MMAAMRMAKGLVSVQSDPKREKAVIVIRAVNVKSYFNPKLATLRKTKRNKSDRMANIAQANKHNI